MKFCVPPGRREAEGRGGYAAALNRMRIKGKFYQRGTSSMA